MKFTKLTIMLVAGSLVLASCAKKKNRSRVRPANAATGAQAPVLPSGQAQTSIPGFDDDNAQNTKTAEQPPLRPDTLGGSEQEGYTPADAPPQTLGDAGSRVSTAPKMETASESEVNGEPPNDGGNHNAECGTAYRANNEMWYPGLPYPPSPVRLCTGHGGGGVREEEMYQCEAAGGYIYTDGRSDGMMKVAADNFHRLPKYMDVSSRRLARRIQDVKIETNLIKLGSVNVTVALFAGKDQTGKPKFNHIRLIGQMKKNGRAKLRAAQGGRIANFEGEITCGDAHGTCDNAILRLDRVIEREQEVLQPSRDPKTKKNIMLKKRARKRAGVGAIALIVIRNGDAHVTMSEAERRGFNAFENPGHKAFAQLLSNTVNNTCLNILADLKEGRRKIPRCAYQRLQQQCARSQYKDPGAAEFNLRSWAVVHGRSAFEFSMKDESGRSILTIRGPLVATNAKPMWSRPLTVLGPMAQGIQNAFLVANDGAGNLNLQLDFAGGGRAQSRFSVTSMSHDVRFGSSEASVAQAPEVESSAFAEQQDVQSESAIAQGEEDGEEQPAAPAQAPAVAAPLAQPPVPRAPITQPVDGAHGVPTAQPPAQQAGAPAMPPPPVDNSATGETTAEGQGQQSIPQVDGETPDNAGMSGSFDNE